MIIKNELISASIMSLLVAILVWWNTPSNPDDKSRQPVLFIKSFLIAFAVTFAFLYFTSDSGTDEVITHMIKGQPDF